VANAGRNFAAVPLDSDHRPLGSASGTNCYTLVCLQPMKRGWPSRGVGVAIGCAIAGVMQTSSREKSGSVTG